MCSSDVPKSICELRSETPKDCFLYREANITQNFFFLGGGGGGGGAQNFQMNVTFMYDFLIRSLIFHVLLPRLHYFTQKKETYLDFGILKFQRSALKTLFRLSRVLLDPLKCILSGVIKFVSVQSSQGILSLFEITEPASVLFSQRFQMQFKILPSRNFSDCFPSHF